MWLNQGVGRVNEFISIFRQRLIDCNWQKWHNHVQTSDRFYMYRAFCNTHEVKPYLMFNIDRHLKYIMTRFRLGVSDLNVHYYRYREFTDRVLICPLCKESKEDEIHFVLCCPVLKEIRQTFIPAKYYRHPCAFKLSLLLSSTKESEVRNLSLFLYKALKFRDIATS